MSDDQKNDKPSGPGGGEDLANTQPMPRIITINTPPRKKPAFTLIQEPSKEAPVLQITPQASVPRLPHVSKPAPKRRVAPPVAPDAPRVPVRVPKPALGRTSPIPPGAIPAGKKPPVRRVFQSTAPLNLILPNGPRKPGKSVPSRLASKQKIPQKRDNPKWLSNRYQIKEKLGDGGTGSVYRADDEFLDNPVAIKVLNPELTFDKDAIATLKEEARIAMRLAHQHIVHLHNLEKSGANYFLVMEYIEGDTLREQLHVFGYFTIDTVAQILSVCSDALTYAHRHGVLHNDLKLENLMLTKEGVLKIIDFGIACLINTRQVGYIMGTPDYMSPEQIRGEELDVRTDEYSLAIIAYELITGRTPFPPNCGFQDILNALPARFPSAPQPLKPVLERATAPIREDRYETVEAFVGAFATAAAPIIAAEAKHPERSTEDRRADLGDEPPIPQIRA